ncbi:MAG: gliding motility lipoprotein GldH [Paludibacteraceae bacterium]
MKPIKYFFLFTIFVGIVACHQNEVYFQYRPVPAKGWDKDSLLVFEYDIQDTVSKYDVFVHVRHYGNYPYQNFWLFMQNTDVNGNTSKDTIECYLADDYGKWLGTGNVIKEMPIYYKQQISLPDSGTYHMTIGHGMRDSLLVGIKEIGVRVEKSVD